MRFRRLTSDEFEEFKTPFVQFLAANGIDAHTWEAIKRTDTVRMNQLMDDFSDIAMLKSLKAVKTLENKIKSSWILLRFTEAWAFMVNIESHNWQETNLLELTLEDIFHDDKHLKNIEVQHGRKAYPPSKREDEIFKNLATGGVWLGDDDLFDALWEAFEFEKHYRFN
jgi:hypothetical protein